MTDDTNQQPAISDADWIAILRNPDMRIGHLQELVRQVHAEIERAREQVIGREAVVRAILAEQSAALARTLALVAKADAEGGR